MTIRTSLLLTALLATQTAPPQAEPAAFTETSASDKARVAGAIFEALTAYENLRSYSGRFSNTVQPYGVTQSGTIQYASPNLMEVRVKITDRTGSYTRRIVCDGSFVWVRDSRFPNRYTKQLQKAGLYYASATLYSAQDSLDMAWFLEGTPPLDTRQLRVTSPPGAPVLGVDIYRPRFPGGTAEKRKELAISAKQAFRFDPTDHLLRGSTYQLLLTGSIHKRTERHWDIKLNPKLPAETFRFKPAPGDRQIDTFDPKP